MELFVNLKEHGYKIYIEQGLIDHTAEKIKKVFKGKKIMIVSDDRVFPIYGERVKKDLQKDFECYEIVIPHGEKSKGFNTLPILYSEFIKNKISRTDLILALGGGVIGDLAGFAAATFLRGVDVIQIPTSLLAQVDSSVGGKTAVDLPQGKNLVGAFYQPKMVLIDPNVLDTLPKRYVVDGMGEVIKYGCIKSAELFDKLEAYGSFETMKQHLEEVIGCCVDIKRQVVEEDEFDTGERLLLNFGHTLAHSIEQYHHYEKESHGEAVAIGMYQITKLAEEKGLSPEGTAERIKKVIEGYGLPSEAKLPLKDLKDTMKLDKKTLNNTLRVVLLKEIGDSYTYATNVDFFEDGKLV